MLVALMADTFTQLSKNIWISKMEGDKSKALKLVQDSTSCLVFGVYDEYMAVAHYNGENMYTYIADIFSQDKELCDFFREAIRFADAVRNYENDTVNPQLN